MGKWRDPVDQFFGAGKVKMPSSFFACWMWTGSKIRGGYGKCTVDKRTTLAHRRAYELAFGPIPDDLTLDHLCHTADESCPGGLKCPHRACVNPLHLEPVPLEENVNRGRDTMPKRMAAKTHCSKGHPYTPENTHYRRTRGYPNPHRDCRACNRERARLNRHANRKAE